MESTPIVSIALPLAIGLIMFGMGLGLTLADFRRVFAYPKAALIGIAAQLLMLPLLGFGIVELTGLTGALAVGLVLISLAPGGATSNAFCQLAKGDVALSVSLTAVVSVVTPFTLPLLLSVATQRYAGEAELIAVPVLKTIGMLLTVTVLPIAFGMLVRGRAPRFADSAERPARLLSVIVLAVLVVGAVVNTAVKEGADLLTWLAEVGPAALLLNVLGVSLGYGLARVAGLERRRQVTIGMEVGIQNGALALGVAHLINDDVAIAPAIYAVMMFGPAALFGLLMNRGKAQATPPAVTDTLSEPSVLGR